MNKQNKIIENLEKCPHFKTCSQNLCPLDLELHKRTGKKQDKCRWMREAKVSKISGKEFISGGSAMSDALLNFVPCENINYLNQTSQKRWRELNKKLI